MDRHRDAMKESAKGRFFENKGKSGAEKKFGKTKKKIRYKSVEKNILTLEILNFRKSPFYFSKMALHFTPNYSCALFYCTLPPHTVAVKYTTAM